MALTADEVKKKAIRLSMKEVWARVRKKPMNMARRAPDQLRLFFLRPLECNAKKRCYEITQRRNLTEQKYRRQKKILRVRGPGGLPPG